MKYANFCRNMAIVLFVVAIIGAFPLAKEASTENVLAYDWSDKHFEEETDKGEYAAVLIASWISSGIVCMFLYGIGEILECLHLLNEKILTPGEIEWKVSSFIEKNKK